MFIEGIDAIALTGIIGINIMDMDTGTGTGTDI